MRKPTIWVSDTNQRIQSQKQARSKKFWIYIKEELHYLVKTKVLISCADYRFSHSVAHFKIISKLISTNVLHVFKETVYGISCHLSGSF